MCFFLSLTKTNNNNQTQTLQTVLSTRQENSCTCKETDRHETVIHMLPHSFGAHATTFLGPIVSPRYLASASVAGEKEVSFSSLHLCVRHVDERTDGGKVSENSIRGDHSLWKDRATLQLMQNNVTIYANKRRWQLEGNLIGPCRLTVYACTHRKIHHSEVAQWLWTQILTWPSMQMQPLVPLRSKVFQRRQEGDVFCRG